MNCPNCGKETQGNFCSNCGATLTVDEPEDRLTEIEQSPAQHRFTFAAAIINKYPHSSIFGIIAFLLSVATVLFSGLDILIVICLAILTAALIVLSFWEVQKKPSASRGFAIVAAVFVCIGLAIAIITAVLPPVSAAPVTVSNQGTPAPTATSVVAATPTATLQPTATLEPSATPEPTPSPTPDVFSVEYDVGQYKVGLDIAAGEYIAISDGWMGYICVSSDANADDIIYNDTFETNTIFTVYDGEYLELSSCIAYLADEFYSAYTIRLDQDGIMLKVGYDIPAGEYKLETDEDDFGYYCIYNNSRHAKIIKNNIFEGSSYVTVKDGQYLELSGCFIVDADLAAVPTPESIHSASTTAAPAAVSTATPTAAPASAPTSAPTAAPTVTPDAASSPDAEFTSP